jgi:hypothetical protein
MVTATLSQIETISLGDRLGLKHESNQYSTGIQTIECPDCGKPIDFRPETLCWRQTEEMFESVDVNALAVMANSN